MSYVDFACGLLPDAHASTTAKRTGPVARQRIELCIVRASRYHGTVEATPRNASKATSPVTSEAKKETEAVGASRALPELGPTPKQLGALERLVQHPDYNGCSVSILWLTREVRRLSDQRDAARDSAARWRIAAEEFLAERDEARAQLKAVVRASSACIDCGSLTTPPRRCLGCRR